MAFLTQRAYQERVKTPILSTKFAYRIASGMFGWNQVNQFCKSTWNMQIEEFLEQYKAQSKIAHHVPEQHVRRIPKTGPLIIVANHPTGIPDGLAILDTIIRIRKDVKIIANELMHSFPPLAAFTIPVDPYGTKEAVTKNIGPLKLVFEWLNAGHCIVLFPSGDVGDLDTHANAINENPWHSTAKKILLRFDGNVLPWVINGSNSNTYYRVAGISPVIKSALLPREGLNRKNRPLQSHIGKPIVLKRGPESLFDLETTFRLLSQVTGSIPTFRFQNKLQKNLKEVFESKTSPLIDKIDPDLLEKEISSLGNPLTSKGPLQVFSFEGTTRKNLIQEIGRLREKTFREVNEGTGNPLDLDIYDQTCTHLVLWDSKERCVAGGYRMSFGSKMTENVFENSSLNPHYYDHPKMREILVKSVLLGRAFVSLEYQCKPFPLFLLWNAIEMLVKADHQIAFIIGQTSIPSTYQEHSKSMVVSFLKKHYQHSEFSAFFTPKKKFTPLDNPYLIDSMNKGRDKDLKRQDQIISDHEKNGAKITVLFKRYLDQGAKFLSANIDPTFNNSLDVLMISSIADIGFSSQIKN